MEVFTPCYILLLVAITARIFFIVALLLLLLRLQQFLLRLLLGLMIEAELVLLEKIHMILCRLIELVGINDDGDDMLA